LKHLIEGWVVTHQETLEIGSLKAVAKAMDFRISKLLSKQNNCDNPSELLKVARVLSQLANPDIFFSEFCDK